MNEHDREDTNGYEPPAGVELGTIRDLTAGKGGSSPDFLTKAEDFPSNSY